MVIIKSIIQNGNGIPILQLSVDDFEEAKRTVDKIVRKHIDCGDEVHYNLPTLVDVYRDDGTRYIIYKRI